MVTGYCISCLYHVLLTFSHTKKKKQLQIELLIYLNLLYCVTFEVDVIVSILCWILVLNPNCIPDHILVHTVCYLYGTSSHTSHIQ